MEEEAVQWLKSLVLLSFGEVSGFNFIAEQRGLSVTKMNAYKMICSNSLEDDSFGLILAEDQVPIVLSQAISKILQGDLSSIFDLFLSYNELQSLGKKYKKGNFAQNIEEYWENHEDERIREGMMTAKRSMNLVYQLIKGETMNKQDLETILDILNLKEYSPLIVGLHGLLTRDCDKIMQVFRHFYDSKGLVDKDYESILKSIIEFASNPSNISSICKLTNEI